jgi:hypothetical protein
VIVRNLVNRNMPKDHSFLCVEGGWQLHELLWTSKCPQTIDLQQRSTALYVETIDGSNPTQQHSAVGVFVLAQVLACGKVVFNLRDGLSCGRWSAVHHWQVG